MGEDRDRTFRAEAVGRLPRRLDPEQHGRGEGRPRRGRPPVPGFFDAALRSKATPAAADWAAVEGNKDIDKVFSSIASGTSGPKQAAETFDKTVGKVLNAQH